MLHNGSNCDYHLIIKKLAKEFKEQFGYLGANTGKYITFSTNSKKYMKMIKCNIYNEIINSVRITSVRFMVSSISNLAVNLGEGLHNSKCKDCRSSREYIKVKNTLLIFQCLK